jgi:hypothetical protein
VVRWSPGESLTLRFDDYYYMGTGYSSFTGTLPIPGTKDLYALVDSYGAETWGAVFESAEENNVYGPHEITVVEPGSTPDALDTSRAPAGPLPQQRTGPIVQPPPRPLPERP